MGAREAQIPTLMSAFVDKRDNFTTRYRHRDTGIFAPGKTGGPMAFNELITEHAVQLAALLPPMNLAQWEALSELSSSYLAHLRMIESSKK